MQCSCGEEKSFRKYVDQSNEKLIGINCILCGKEWLNDEYATRNRDAKIVFQKQELYDNEHIFPQVKESFQVNGNRTQLPKDDWTVLTPGDHITWHRPWIIWHHAIVVNVDKHKRRLELIHWNKVEGAETENKIHVVKEWIRVDQQFGSLYRIDYPMDINETNPPSLVLSRAHSKLGETKYDLLTNNCESMAAFCKTGVSESCQVRWLWGKMKEILDGVKAQIATATAEPLREIIHKEDGDAGKKTLAECIEQRCDQSGGGLELIPLLIESGCMLWDIANMYENRIDGQLSKKDFIESSAQRLMEALSAVGLAIIGTVAGKKYGEAIGAAISSDVFLVGTNVGTSIGIVLGKVVLGSAGLVGGRVLGSFFGQQLGMFIANFIKWDDKAVTDICQISRADQIVLCPSVVHPRCHAIVVETNPETNLLYVIRNTIMNGVVREWIPFERPIYKVIYNEGDSYEPDDVITRAESKIDVKKYNIFTNNCKDFAVWCKYKNS